MRARYYTRTREVPPSWAHVVGVTRQHVRRAEHAAIDAIAAEAAALRARGHRDCRWPTQIVVLINAAPARRDA